MSKIICSAAIRGAHKIVDMAEEKYEKVLKQFGPEQKVGFPNTGYYLPVIYSILGAPVKQLGDMKEIFQECRKLLPAPVSDQVWLPYLAPALDAGMATFFAEEMHEAMRYVEEPGLYAKTEDPTDDCLWLGAADDVIFRKRGVEFVDGTAPGFAAILGTPSDPEVAEKIALELQQKNLYIFMHDQTDGISMPDQLAKQNVQIGWSTRLVPFGPTYTSAVFAMGFACRVALAFGGIKPGDFKGNLIYNKDRTFAFVIAFGPVSDEWYANAAGAINWGFPTIADTDITQILPTGICTYEHVVAPVSHDEICAKSVEVRGLKTLVSDIEIPCSFGPAYEGERVRGADLFCQTGGGKSQCTELCKMAEMDAIEDGKVEIIGPDIGDLKEGDTLPLGIYAQIAGREFQTDFEPIIERQIHHLINYIQGIMHIGQRDISWIRVGKAAVEKGFTLKDIGVVLHAKFHQDFGNILDKVQITLYTKKKDVDDLTKRARGEYKKRDERVENMTDESVETYYSCTLCQSFAPNHVCSVSPERTGLCGAYNWMDCKASFEINPTGPNQPIEKGECIDPVLGQWKGVNDFVFKASRGAVTHYNFYSIVNDPMTTCGCCECIAAMLPSCNGVMTVGRDYAGETPCGMKFTTLAGVMGGGAQSPGFVGHSKYNITQGKFITGDGGLARMVWMPKILKEEIKERIDKRGKEIGVPDLYDMIADETVGITEEEILPWLEKKGHPALKMDPLIG